MEQILVPIFPPPPRKKCLAKVTSRYDVGTNIIMLKCSDHGTTFPDSHSKILPLSHIYGSKAIVLIRFQPPKKHLNKTMLESTVV